jgi:predicted lipid-binding transport protein (Tim44 family)
VGFLGYGFYLAFLFEGGSYIVFFQAFILPLLLIARTIRGAMEARSQRSPAQASPAFDQLTPAAPEPAPAGSAQSSDPWGPPPSSGEEPARH